MATIPSSAQISPGRRWVTSPSWSPMRNFAVTGTPYGAAAATAAPTMARSRRRAGRHGGAAALARHLGRRAPEVEVDVVDEPAIAHGVDGPTHHHGIGPVDLQAARVLVGLERHHPRRLGVAVHERRRHHHLVDVDEPRPEPPAQRPERRVRHARHRRQHDRRRRHEVPEPQVPPRRGYGRGQCDLSVAIASVLRSRSSVTDHAASSASSPPGARTTVRGTGRMSPRYADSAEHGSISRRFG